VSSLARAMQANRTMLMADDLVFGSVFVVSLGVYVW
jgi:hypothetical protein